MTLTSLITASEGFPALERLAMSATRELVMSFRILDPRTKLHCLAHLDQGMTTWADLLTEVARKGVRIRLILADFDPVFAEPLHRLAWRSATGFAQSVKGDVQILCAPHGQLAGPVWRWIMRTRIGEKLKDLNSKDPAELTPIQRTLIKGPVLLRPVTLHQKFAVADGTRCIIGGLDVNDRRWDDFSHDQPPDETWHDVSMQVDDADYAAALRLHFCETWNRALDCGTPAMLGEADRMDISQRPQPPADLRLLRTVSEPRRGPVQLAPKPIATEHERAMIQLMGEARHFVYIETQFLRHRPLVDAMVRAAKRAPELQLIIVLPPAADRVLFDSDVGWDARAAHALQTEAANRLAHAFGDRLAMISPAQPVPAKDGEADVLKSGPIYIHSKVCVVDDRVGMVGSANLNGRSMRWDTEASVMFRRPDAAKEIRERLAEKWLGPTIAGASTTQARTWRQAALSNAAKDPQDREGFALPYPMASGRKFARSVPVLPADMF
ncbi:phospholipase D family protein [Salipiger sp. 1_MG-2023]|uniref:phospholipase D family protein n=1 Tax=Salipiger sp. 1_MG-2023 TaxID=3062665 RepID=UPI0026E28B39|nr:phospholipase D family protein [Salipiger sp. 1_MG-2023]MDO6586269.1 phospholipase D family protein [Salipiger sp. 1_MG-2023]